MTPPQSFVEFEWEPNSQNQEFDQTISLRGGDFCRSDDGGVRRTNHARTPSPWFRRLTTRAPLRARRILVPVSTMYGVVDRACR